MARWIYEPYQLLTTNNKSQGPHFTRSRTFHLQGHGKVARLLSGGLHASGATEIGREAEALPGEPKCPQLGRLLPSRFRASPPTTAAANDPIAEVGRVLRSWRVRRPIAQASIGQRKRPRQQTAGGVHHSGPSRYPNAMLSVRLATCLAYFR